MKKILDELYSFSNFDNEDITRNIHLKGEVQANKTAAIAMCNCVFVLVLNMIFKDFNFFTIEERSKGYLLIACIELIIPAIICFARKGRGKNTKYWLLLGTALGASAVFVLLDNYLDMIMVIPLVLSARYYSKKTTIYASVIVAILFVVSSILTVLYGNFDCYCLNLDRDITVTFGRTINLSQAVLATGISKKVLIINMIKYSVLPTLFIWFILTVICVASADYGRKMADDEMNYISNNTRISSELSLARDIQANMLPRIFPAFPDHNEFDVYATMNPAKEVGGDFYDYFMIDDSHIAVVIGDVSGKGIPAALFMVVAKTLLKDYTQLGLTPAEVFTRVNKTLCNGNEIGFFVTSFMAIMDINTGELTYVNAGHNPPLLLSSNDGYQFMNIRPGFVLAGLESIKYRQGTINMTAGDKLFLYTDGITEAINTENEMYGDERLKNFLDSHNSLSVKPFLEAIKADVDEFVGEAQQFDDQTMLILEFKGKSNSLFKEKLFNADSTELENVISFVDEEMEAGRISPKERMQIDVVVEEIFVNIAHYAYPGRSGEAKVSVSVNDGYVMLLFKDTGIPFNPLDKDDPDIRADADSRDIGGLGIFMVKKMMDDVYYDYSDGMNILVAGKQCSQTGE